MACSFNALPIALPVSERATFRAVLPTVLKKGLKRLDAALSNPPIPRPF